MATTYKLVTNTNDPVEADWQFFAYTSLLDPAVEEVGIDNFGCTGVWTPRYVSEDVGHPPSAEAVANGWWRRPVKAAAGRVTWELVTDTDACMQREWQVLRYATEPPFGMVESAAAHNGVPGWWCEMPQGYVGYPADKLVHERRVRKPSAQLTLPLGAAPQQTEGDRLLAFFLARTPSETVRAAWPGEDD